MRCMSEWRWFYVFLEYFMTMKFDSKYKYCFFTLYFDMSLNLC